MMIRPIRFSLAIALVVVSFAAPNSLRSRAAEPIRPNVIVILADDIGYGDFGCYGATKVKTPNLDRLVTQGLRFTDAHSPASVCTPTRFAMLTGQYAFRHKPGSAILSGVAPLSIPADRFTLPQLMKKAGYQTAVVGKWHLGLGETETNYNLPIVPGPREVGFDYSFIIPATGDRTPCVFVENGSVVNYDPNDPITVNYAKKVGNDPTGKENPELLTKQKPSVGHNSTIVNGISRIGWMTGGTKARWKDEDIADTITAKATKYIADNKANPFFLYFATHDIHVPRLPHERYQGKSGCGLRGDAIQQFDGSVGEVLKALDDAKIADNTLVIVTSDNGGVMDDGYQDGSGNDKSGHKCNGTLRGYKGSLFEGGHRVPMIVRWPGKTPADKVSNELICHVDLISTFSAMLDVPIPAKAAPDSFNQLSALLTVKSDKPTRDHLIHQANGVVNLAIRKGNWKYIPPPAKSPAGTLGQLFDLSNDLSETKNVAAENPDKVKELSDQLEAIRKAEMTRK
ncbi:MAG: arylsulfatase [Gemmataceae bacterium]